MADYDIRPLQLRILKILLAVDKVCKEHGLRYYIMAGTMLGAVRHKGFIPWDDDIDVGMFRDDYEIFIEKGQQYLPENYFIQNYKTDFGFPTISSKLRDSNTTYIEKTVSELTSLNHGIYIDIFPIDGYPKNKLKAAIFEVRKKSYRRKLATVFKTERSLKTQILYRFYRLLGCHKRIDKIAKSYENMIKKYKIQDSDIAANHANWQGKLEYADKSQYGKGCEAYFEGLKVIIPEKYDEYLRQKYGDYTKPLPKEEQVGHHYYEVMDTEKSYLLFFQKKEK